MGISKNIKSLRMARDWTQEQLADKIGVTRSTVTQWETGWSQPRMGAVEKLAAAFGVTVSEMVSEDDEIKMPKNAKPVQGIAMGYVPLRGRVHAGPFTTPENLEAREEMVLIPQFLIDADPDTYALESEGDCMNKVYPEGCIIIVSPNREPQNGSVAVVALDCNDSIMRRMVRTSSTLILSPESWNPEHKDIIITEDSDHSVEFWGKVVWFQSGKEME